MGLALFVYVPMKSLILVGMVTMLVSCTTFSNNTPSAPVASPINSSEVFPTIFINHPKAVIHMSDRYYTPVNRSYIYKQSGVYAQQLIRKGVRYRENHFDCEDYARGFVQFIKEDLAVSTPQANPLVGYMYYTTRENVGHAIVLFGVVHKGKLELRYLEVTVLGGYPYIITLTPLEKTATRAVFL